MESTTETARQKIERLINTLQGEALLAEFDDLQNRLDRKDETIANYRHNETARTKQLFDAREAVRNFFKEEFDGDKDATVTFTLDEVNDLLDLIDADKLSFTYSATVRIEFTVTGIEADSEEDAENIVRDNLQYQLIGELRDNNMEDESVEVEDVEAE
jgi:hypothetical protein